MKNRFTRIKIACYSSNVTQAIVINLSPLLFITFRDIYGLSYSSLGFLILINFLSQLAIDIVFTLFSHKFNIPLTVKLMPVFSMTGLLIYGFSPLIFGEAVYAGLIIGTVVFSAGSGLGEVLLSTIFGAIPADNPDREMSKLHSVYAWGSVFSVLTTTFMIYILGDKLWPVIPIVYSLLPLFSFLMYLNAELPLMETPEKLSGTLGLFKNQTVWICVAAIFFGSVAENIMSQWSSGFLERGLGITKLYGDILGVAGFALMLGIARTLYANFGRKIERVLLLGGIGACFSFLLCIISNNPVVCIFACALAGLSTSMLWPGSLIVAAEKMPTAGVFVYAVMAAGGDLGASLGPQLVGLVTDTAMLSPTLLAFAERLSLTPDQFGMKLGYAVGMLFPLAGIIIYAHLIKSKNRQLKK